VKTRPTHRASRLLSELSGALQRNPGQSADGQDASDRVAALAKALGVSEAKVQAAMQATRPSGAPQATPSGAAPPSGSAPSTGSASTSSS
jgi:hypothetical protein